MVGLPLFLHETFLTFYDFEETERKYMYNICSHRICMKTSTPFRRNSATVLHFSTAFTHLDISYCLPGISTHYLCLKHSVVCQMYYFVFWILLYTEQIFQYSVFSKLRNIYKKKDSVTLHIIINLHKQ